MTGYSPKPLFFCLALFVAASLVLPSFALGSQDTPPWALEADSKLKAMVDEVLVIIRDHDLRAHPERQEKALVDKAFQIFDFNTFSMLSLGPKYRDFSEQQRQDFIFYFSKLISQTYFPKLAGKDVDNLTVNYLKNAPLKPKRDIFRTDIHTELVQGELIVPVVYRMIRKEGSDWRVYDIKIEGVSMAANYREQYRQQISSTPDQIIAQLKEKVSQ